MLKGLHSCRLIYFIFIFFHNKFWSFGSLWFFFLLKLVLKFLWFQILVVPNPISLWGPASTKCQLWNTDTTQTLTHQHKIIWKTEVIECNHMCRCLVGQLYVSDTGYVFNLKCQCFIIRRNIYSSKNKNGSIEKLYKFAFVSCI